MQIKFYLPPKKAEEFAIVLAVPTAFEAVLVTEKLAAWSEPTPVMWHEKKNVHVGEQSSVAAAVAATLAAAAAV